jgi:hypothetical protein
MAVDDDPRVVAVLVHGSWAHRGLATTNSDVDLYVVLDVADCRWRSTRQGPLDVAVWTLDRLRQVPSPTDPDSWPRYSFKNCRFLLEKADGEVARLTENWGRLSGAESLRVLEANLDGYYNFVYRSLKCHRDGRLFEARLDAAESLVWGLSVLFAFEGRVRPYNKYLSADLERHAFERSGWETSRLIPLIDQVLADADSGAQRSLFGLIEAAAREVGLGGIADGWEDDLAFMRGNLPAPKTDGT